MKSLPAAKNGAVTLLIGTRKGAFTLKSDRTRRTWKLSPPLFLGHIVHHVVCDPRDRRTILMAASTGHLGPTLFRSADAGKTWKESPTPPAFAKVSEGGMSRSVNHTFWLTPCHSNEPNAWYAGTSPQGLFRSDDGGVTWKPFSYINDDPQYREWMGTVQDGTPVPNYTRSSWTRAIPNTYTSPCLAAACTNPSMVARHSRLSSKGSTWSRDSTRVL